MHRRGLIGVSILASALFTACSGGGTSPGPPNPTAPPDITQSYTFPSGDTISTSGSAWDIIGLKTTLGSSGFNLLKNSYDKLRVDVIFAQDVSNALPAPGVGIDASGNQLGVILAIDSDGKPTTGHYGVCSSASQSNLPFEYVTDPGTFSTRLADGNFTIIANNVAIYTGPSNPSEEAAVAVNGHTLSLSFDLNTLGVFDGSAIPHIGIGAAAINNNLGQVTDCVPTGRNGVTEVFTTN